MRRSSAGPRRRAGGRADIVGAMGASADVEQRSGRKGCEVEGCDRAHNAKGLCAAHYRQNRLGLARADLRPLGPLRPLPRPAAERGCEIAGCARPHAAKGLCHAHYTQERYRGWDRAAMLPVDPSTRTWPPCPEQGCEVEGCDRPHSAKPGSTGGGVCLGV